MGNFDMPDSVVISILDAKKQNQLHADTMVIQIEISGIYIYIQMPMDLTNELYYEKYHQTSFVFNQHNMLSV